MVSEQLPTTLLHYGLLFHGIWSHYLTLIYLNKKLRIGNALNARADLGHPDIWVETFYKNK